MIRKELLVANKLGLHTRAAAKLVDTAKRFASKIEISYKDRVVDCKSIMGVITLGAPCDCQVIFMINGEDEEEAMTAIEKLFVNKFGED